MSPEVDVLFRTLLKMGCTSHNEPGKELQPSLMLLFSNYLTERGKYSDFQRRLSGGESFEEIQVEYGELRPDYGTAFFTLGGVSKSKWRADWTVEFLGADIEVSPRLRRLLAGRKLELDQARMKVVAAPPPDAEFVRRIWTE